MKRGVLQWFQCCLWRNKLGLLPRYRGHRQLHSTGTLLIWAIRPRKQPFVSRLAGSKTIKYFLVLVSWQSIMFRQCRSLARWDGTVMLRHFTVLKVEGMITALCEKRSLKKSLDWRRITSTGHNLSWSRERRFTWFVWSGSFVILLTSKSKGEAIRILNWIFDQRPTICNI